MRLSDCFIKLIAYIAYFLKNVDKKQPGYEQVKNEVLRLLSETEEFLRQNIFAEAEYDMARFAVCAWVDEAILTSSWREKSKWQRETLQFRYYGTADAGEDFFNKLNILGLHQRDVREVYYLCLAMGFKGRYHDEKDKYLLEQVKASNLKLLFGSSLGPPSLDRGELFPEAYITDTREMGKQKGDSRLTPLNLLGFGIPLLLFIILFFIFSFILGDIAKIYISMVP